MSVPKVKLYSQKTYSDGKHPVVVQVIVDRKVYKQVLFPIEAKFWDKSANRVKKEHPLNVKYNALIISSLHNIESRLLDSLINKQLKLTRDYIFGEKTKSISLEDAISEYISDLNNRNKYVAAEKLKHLNKRINDFNPKIQLSDVDKSFLDSFHAFLLNTNSPNTAAKNCNSIITVLRYFAKKGMYNDNAAIGNRFSYKKTTKNKLTTEELKRFMNIELPAEGVLPIARDCFMLSFYLRGMRISDVLTIQWTEVKEDRIKRIALKSEKNIDILIPKRAMDIINKYKGLNDIYVIPLMKMKPVDSLKFMKQIESKTAMINPALKVIAGMAMIDKNISTHVARHTFAYLADQSGMTAKRIQDLLDHYDLKTTENYIEDLNKNDILDKTVTSFLDNLFE